MFKCFIMLTIYISLFGCQAIQKKSFENKLNKNRAKRCISRAKDNCNSNRTVCKLYDKKGTEECQNELDKCVKKSALKCESQYH